MGGGRPNRLDAEGTERSPELEAALDAAEVEVLADDE